MKGLCVCVRKGIHEKKHFILTQSVCVCVCVCFCVVYGMIGQCLTLLSQRFSISLWISLAT